MKKLCLASLLSIFLLFLPKSVQALPSSNLWLPTTDTMEKSYLRLDLQQEYALVDKDAGKSNYYSSIGAVFGISQTKAWGLEAGLDYVEPAGTSSIDSVNFSAKASYLPKENGPWKLAFGVRNLTVGADTNAQIFYALTDIYPYSNDITRLGIYLGNNSVLQASDGSNSSSGLLFGYYKKLTNDWGRLALEWISGKNFYSGILLGTHFRFAQEVDCVVGYMVPGDSSFQQRILVRVSLYY